MESTVTKKDVLLFLSSLDISTPIPSFRVEENLRTLSSKHDKNPPSVNTSLRNRFYFLSLSRRNLRLEKVTDVPRGSECMVNWLQTRFPCDHVPDPMTTGAHRAPNQAGPGAPLGG